jgi:hypothetical protein
MMGTDVASAQQFGHCLSKHDKTYASLEKTLAAVSSHGNEVFPRLRPDRRACPSTRARLPAFRTVRRHVFTRTHQCEREMYRVVCTEQSGFGTRRIANLMRLKMSVLDPTMGRAAPVMMVCTAPQSAIVKQIDLHFFEENQRASADRAIPERGSVCVGGRSTRMVAHHDSEWGQVPWLCLLFNASHRSGRSRKFSKQLHAPKSNPS